jgi:hypothetical protein
MERIIRKLGKKETYLATLKNDYEKLVSVSNIKSNIDLTKNDLIAKAIGEWKRMHPFLNSSLIKQNDDFYFSLLENNNDSKSVFRNVQILSNENIENQKYLIELLVEKELNTKFDLYNELFWRIIFFKTTINDHNQFSYTIIFTVHHFICEAKYKYLSLLDLFNLIENFYKLEHNKTIEIPLPPYKVLGCLEDLFRLDNSANIDFTFPKIPSFIDPINAKVKSIANEYYKKNFMVNLNS